MYYDLYLPLVFEQAKIHTSV